MTYELKTTFDSRQSFYGKARVETSGGWDQNLNLYSYNTLVARIGYDESSELVAQVYNLQSPTTLRHVKEFLKQQGFRADNKKQIESDYWTDI